MEVDRGGCGPVEGDQFPDQIKEQIDRLLSRYLTAQGKEKQELVLQHVRLKEALDAAIEH